MLLPPAARFG